MDPGGTVRVVATGTRIPAKVSRISGFRQISNRTRIRFTVEHEGREEELVALRTKGLKVFDGTVG